MIIAAIPSRCKRQYLVKTGNNSQCRFESRAGLHRGVRASNLPWRNARNNLGANIACAPQCLGRWAYRRLTARTPIAGTFDTLLDGGRIRADHGFKPRFPRLADAIKTHRTAPRHRLYLYAAVAHPTVKDDSAETSGKQADFGLIAQASAGRASIDFPYELPHTYIQSALVWKWG
jgi:hypothetical protein